MRDGAQLSAWWGRGVAITFMVGFGVLIFLTAKAYENAPPVPERIVGSAGEVIFTGDDVRSGQEVFLKYGLMANGSVWGHGGYLGPDFSATVLHNWAVELGGQQAQARFGKQYEALSDADRAAIDGEVGTLLKANLYDPATGILTLWTASVATFASETGRWKAYFQKPELNGGLSPNLISDPKELHDLTAFFFWAAWGSVAQRPGTTHSYTNNFPYDSQAGNRPTGAALLWSAISIVSLVGGIALVLLAFGKFDYLGWHGEATAAER